MRRKFFEAVPPEASKSNQERLQLRQKKLAPLMEEFFDWCRKHKAMTLTNSKLGKVFAYSLNHETTFKHVLLDSRLVLSNNLAERAIKTLVIERKNWLFSQSFNGAKSSIILSLIETAK
ncbi:MAG: transposase, partial [Lactobacillus amylovorus]